MDYKEEWLEKSKIIPEKYSEVEILNVTDYLRHRDFLKRRREREWKENLPIAQAKDTSVEQDVRDEIDSVFIVRQEKYQKLVNDEYELIEREVLDEEERTADIDNGLNAYIPSLRQLCLNAIPSSEISAHSLTTHCDMLDPSRRKSDVSDDSSLSSEDEGIDVNIPMTYPSLPVKKIINRVRRFERRRKGTYKPRYYHQKQFPVPNSEAILEEVERRKRLAEEARTHELPNKWTYHRGLKLRGTLRCTTS